MPGLSESSAYVSDKDSQVAREKVDRRPPSHVSRPARVGPFPLLPAKSEEEHGSMAAAANEWNRRFRP